jgi:hypothetical protein
MMVGRRAFTVMLKSITSAAREDVIAFRPALLAAYAPIPVKHNPASLKIIALYQINKSNLAQAAELLWSL